LLADQPDRTEFAFGRVAGLKCHRDERTGARYQRFITPERVPGSVRAGMRRVTRPEIGKGDVRVVGNEISPSIRRAESLPRGEVFHVRTRSTRWPGTFGKIASVRREGNFRREARLPSREKPPFEGGRDRSRAPKGGFAFEGRLASLRDKQPLFEGQMGLDPEGRLRIRREACLPSPRSASLRAAARSSQPARGGQTYWRHLAAEIHD
jgi:hypothetical protein